MQISAPIPEFSAPFSHTTVTHKIITIYSTPSTMNLGPALSFYIKKTNHSTCLTVSGTGVNGVHVSKAITPTLHNENA
jgi:aspartate-semialdehyde dehydrogenase